MDKWRTRWPEWRVLEVFLPEGQRRVAVAWFALLQEFEDAMNVAGDPLPADAKLGWWGEELRDWSGRRSRHPLGRLLEPLGLDWNPLAAALPLLVQARSRPLDQDSGAATLQPLAAAIALLEAQIFGQPRGARGQAAILARLQAARVEAGTEDAVPMRIGGGAGTRGAWTRRLLQDWPRREAGTLPRRLFSALARARLQRAPDGAPRAPLRPLVALWLGWRAARH